MKKERLFVNGLMRLAACAVMVSLGVGSALAQSIAPINPAFKQWQKEHRQKSVRHNAQHNFGMRRVTRLLSAVNETEDNEGGFFGLAPSLFDSSYLSDINISADRGVNDALPARYDLRDKGFLTPVKNQGYYGTCWAHATLASLESGLLVEGKGLYDLSEKNMAMLHGGDWMFDDGGNAERSSAYLLRWAGPCLETEDPYPPDSYYLTWFFDNHYWDESGGTWEYKYSYALDSILPESPNRSPSFHVQNVRWIPKRNSYLDNATIKEAVVTHGALHVSYYHSDGYYKSSTAAYYNSTILYRPGSNERKTNHAVELVGWDDNFSAKNFAKTPPGDGAFIVRNSWGTDWGENGYFYVSYYDESFAWNTLYSFSNAEPTDNYDSIYEYDPLGHVSAYGYKCATAWGANMFQAKTTTKVSAVGFYAMTPNTTYTIYVYTGCTAGAPRSGTLAVMQSGRSEYAGYVTVPLTVQSAVSVRQMFSVVIQLTTPGYNFPLAFEYAYPGYTSDATASSGESFLSSNGSSWSDFTQVYGSANFCLKVYTKAAVLAKPTLSSIAITGVSSLTAEQMAQFTCEATYSDGSKRNVTTNANWSIARAGQMYATVSPTGVVTAKTVSAQQTVTVQASYTEDGITKEDAWGMYVTVGAPEAPTGVTATQGTEPSCIRVNWTAPGGATEYAVYRATANNSKNAQYLENVTVARFNDTGSTKPVVPGVDYWYFVKAKNSSGSSGFSAGASGWRKLSPPESVTASDTLLDKVTVSWSEVEGATHYRVYRAESIDGEKTALGGWQTETTFDDNRAAPGVPYCYFVVAAVDASGNRPSDYSIVEDGMRALPVAVDYLEIKGDTSIPSGGSANYTADAIYTDGHRVENVTPISWEIDGEGASVANGRVTAATVRENKNVTLTANYTEGGKVATGTKRITITVVKPNAPRNVSAIATASGVTLSWNTVSGAAQYVVYRDGGEAGRVITSAPNASPATTYADNTAVPGVAYSYTVSAVNGAGEGPQSSPSVVATVPLPAPTGVTATSDRTDGVLVDWRRAGDVAPYQSGTYYWRVARATSASGAKTELGSWRSETTFLDETAPTDVELYYFVRAAKDANGANAGAWSAGAVGRRIVAKKVVSLAVRGARRIRAGGTALYSCMATFDDDSTEAVSPVWSVAPSGSALIGADGRLTAELVGSDVIVTVSATYGGKTGSRDVTILVPFDAVAQVSNVKATPRWPFGTLVDIDYTLATTPAGTKAAVSLIGHDNDHNRDIAATTLTGDGADGPADAGARRITWDVGADHPGLHVKDFSVSVDAVPLVAAAPTNVAASMGTSSLGVDLSWSSATDAVGYEVWRGTSSMQTEASNVVTVTEGTVYCDTNTIAGTIYFYWIRTVTDYGTSRFSGSTAGYRKLANVAVTFDANGGTASMSSSTYTAGTPYGTLPTATRTGYEFVGWFTERTGGTQVFDDTPVAGTVTTLYAHWTANTYTVTFDKQGGNGGTSSVTATYDAAMPAITVPTRTGYTFGGYYTSTGGGGTQYYTASGASARTWDRTSATTLYAKWTPNTYAIRFNANNGTGTMSDLAMTYDTAKNLTSNVYTRAGYAFAGWATSSGGSVVYADGANVSNLTATQGAVVNLYAIWAAFSTALDTSAMSFTTGGDANWLVVTNESYYGGSSARSGAIGHSKSTWLQGEITGAGLLSFWYKVSSESSCDKMTFYIDDVQKTSVSGTGSGWNQLEYSVTNNASHTFKWVYSKDGSAVRGEDCCWIDKVSWTQIVPPTGVTATQDRTDGIVISWTASVGATSYEIYRGTYSSSGSSSMIGTSTTTSYTDTTAVGDTTYYYWVKAVGSSTFSSGTSGRRIKTLTSVEIDGPDALMSECGGYYAAYANYSDGTRANVSQSATTTIATNLFATLSGEWDGNIYYKTLTGKSVEARQSVTMTASYTYSGVTKTATKTISILPAGNLTYTYRTRPDGTAELTGYKGDNNVTELTLPSSINGLTVTRTSGRWMLNLSSLTRVTIPSSFTEVASSMFYDCYKLTSVTIPNSVTNVNEYAFSSCYSLASVSMPNSVRSIGYHAFSYCSSLQQMVIPSSVKTIGSDAFYYCSSLRQVVIPDSVTSIGSYAFEGCSSLTSVTIPDSVTRLSDVFRYCYALQTVNLPENLSSIGSDSFTGCTNLTSFTISGNNAYYKTENGILFNKAGTELIHYPANKSGTSYTVPSTVTSIGDYAFYQCQNLTSITIPSSVTTIGRGAFIECQNLTSITIPSSVTSIGKNAFYHSPKLQAISVASANPSYRSVDGILYNKNKTTLVCYPLGKATAYVMPDFVRQNIDEDGGTNLAYLVWSESCLTFNGNTFLAPLAASIKFGNSLRTIYGGSSRRRTSDMSIPFGVKLSAYDSFRSSSGTKWWFGDWPSPGSSLDSGGVNYRFLEAEGWSSKSISGGSVIVWTNAVLSLEIDGENKVFAGCSVPLYAKGSFESGHFGIASKADWMVVSGSSYASINPSNGMLTANANVTTTRNIGVYAYTTLGGASAYANTYNVQIVPANTNTALIAIGKYAYNRLRWLPYPNAAKYNIRRGTNSSYSNATVIDTYLKETLDGTETFVDDTAALGTTYYYWVEALDSNGISLNVTDCASAYRLTGDLTYVRDVLTKLNNGTYSEDSFVTDAERGVIKELNYWKGVNSTWMSYIQNNNLSSIAGANEMFWRSMYDLNTYIGLVMRMQEGPSIAKVTFADSTSATIMWNAKLGATSYQLYRGTSANSSSASRIATISGTSYTNTSLSAGTQYYYWVKAVTPMGTTNFGPLFVVTSARRNKVQLWDGGPYWAETNIGAEKPEDYGYYFWWGDIVGYKREGNSWVASDGSSSNFSFKSGNTPTYGKDIATLQSEGWITVDSILAPEHDAAHVRWGGDWRMPTRQELFDLGSKCDWVLATQNGVDGYVVRGRGGYVSNSIFLPCAGRGNGTSLDNAGSYGYSWSSVPSSGSNGAWDLDFYSGDHRTYNSGRYRGHSVRPVQGFTE